jgi:hypothetical protein
MNKFKQIYMKVSSPHYFYGRSPIKLLIHNFVRKIEFFRRRGPSGELLRATKNLAGSKSGKTALVLGSGPSLDSLQVSTARNYFDEIFVVNNYYLHDIAKELTPDYYCLSDPNHFVDDKTNAVHEDESLFGYLVEKNVTLLLSHFYRKKTFTPGIKILFFNDREWRGLRKNISPIKPRSYGSFTLYKALALACYFGYETIYILGLDNTEFKSYVGSIDNKIYMNNSNNYANSNIELTITTSPEGFTSGIAGRMQSYALQFGDLHFFKNFNIINLDPNSLIDAFEKTKSHPAIKQ